MKCDTIKRLVKKRGDSVRINVLGVGFDNVTMKEAVARGTELLGQPGAHYVVTPNPEIVEVCRENPEAMRAVNGADLVLADGIGVVKGARMLGTPLKTKVPGIEFAAGLMEEMAAKGMSLYLLGAKPGVAETAGKRLAEKYPGLTIAGTHDGYFQDDGPVIEAIRNSGADAVFVCLGAPKQELWMARNGSATNARLLCGLGGSLDVFAGTVKRAPRFWSDHGLEWFYRLCKEPRRIGRMMKLPLFLVHVQQEKRRK
jgi:N-acetylglucosaminyldiphosphoundecaprenol N-acetyl-beta-D-mannosaminyltransferase